MKGPLGFSADDLLQETLALQRGAQAHVGVGEGAVDLAELIGQGDRRVRLFGRFDPQVEHRPRTGQLAAQRLVFGKLGFEAPERLLQRRAQLFEIGLRPRLVVLLQARQ